MEELAPRVSVCIPAFGQPAALVRAVESVFAQDFQDFEIIVTDDSETDDVSEAIARWRHDERFVYQRNAIRLGSPGNWNAAMRLARSGLVKFLHHDDWLADRSALSQFVSAMVKRPNAMLAFCASNNVDVSGKVISTNKLAHDKLKQLLDKPATLHYENLIGAPSATIFRKSGFAFDLNLSWVVDVDAYLTLLSGSKEGLCYIDNELVSITAGAPHQVTRHFEENPVARVREHLYLYAKHRPAPSLERLRALFFIHGLIRGFSQREVAELLEKRRADGMVLEEKIAVRLTKLVLGVIR